MHRLARALVGRNASLEAAAHEVAECQLQLIRIEEVRVSILSALAMGKPEPTEISPEFMTKVRGIYGTPLMPVRLARMIVVQMRKERRTSLSIGTVLHELTLLMRYQRRASSRLRTLVRALDSSRLIESRSPAAG